MGFIVINAIKCFAVRVNKLGVMLDVKLWSVFKFRKFIFVSCIYIFIF